MSRVWRKPETVSKSSQEAINKDVAGQKSFFRRWMLFFAIFAIIVFLTHLGITAIAQARLAVVPIVNVPIFTSTQLANNIDDRFKYLTSRVDGVKFSIYTVKKGDNLWKIAKNHGYSVHTIIGCNPQFTTYDVYENQKILIPSIGGTLHPIQQNDTWAKIADRYETSELDLKAGNPGTTELINGEYVFVAGKRPSVDLLNEQMQEKYALRDLFISPLGGRYTSGFGKRRHPVTGKTSVHGGLDISAPIGSRVSAAAGGTVILASYNAGYYGVAVYIDHHNGYITHYGHLSKINVSVGQRVKAGQIIARSGATGRVTGPHLHFTVKKNGVAVNPTKFLW
ncbi:MAG: M23 family metallopeptidase [Elusimicrobiota bacterium]|jgi:murein DD-endopeptidase MepM/ murein hydrolase activator NlpD|nr:M23 family metallopeptidase [Elusimicrobiota bacterium]